MSCDLKLTLNKDAVKVYMKENGWSLRRLAREMNVDHSYVSRVFQGKQQPGRRFIEGMVKACKGMDFSKLFFFETVLSDDLKE